MNQKAQGSKRTTYRIGSVEGASSARGRNISEPGRTRLREAAKQRARRDAR